jgi:hypothetical protein
MIFLYFLPDHDCQVPPVVCMPRPIALDKAMQGRTGNRSALCGSYAHAHHKRTQHSEVSTGL